MKFYLNNQEFWNKCAKSKVASKNGVNIYLKSDYMKCYPSPLPRLLMKGPHNTCI